MNNISKSYGRGSKILGLLGMGLIAWLVFSYYSKVTEVNTLLFHNNVETMVNKTTNPNDKLFLKYDKAERADKLIASENLYKNAPDNKMFSAIYAYELFNFIDRKYLWKIDECQEKLYQFAIEKQQLELKKKLIDYDRLPNQLTTTEKNNLRKKIAEYKEQLQPYLKKLIALQKNDPNNALYDYLHAAVLLKTGCSWTMQAPPYDYIIDDKKAFDLGIKRFIKGAKKPYYNDSYDQYRETFIATMKNIYPKANLLNSTCTYFVQPTLGAYSIRREVARKVNFYCNFLAKNNKKDTFRKFYVNVETFLAQDIQCDNLIYVLVNIAVCDIFYNDNKKSKLYSKLFSEKELQKRALQHQKINELRPLSKRKNNREFKKSIDNLMLEAGMFSQMFIYLQTSGLNSANLKPERMAWYSFNDDLWCSVLLVITFFMTIALALRYVFSKASWTKDIIKPTAKELKTLLLFGIILPLAIFFTITNWDFLGNRNLNILANANQALAQGLLLITTVIAGGIWAIMKIIKSRCQKNGELFPIVFYRVYGVVTVYTLLFITIFCLDSPLTPADFVNIDCEYFVPDFSYKINFIIVAILSGILMLVFLVYLIFMAISSAILPFKKYAQFRNALTVNSLAYFIIVIPALVVILQFFFNKQESSYIKKDKIVFSTPNYEQQQAKIMLKKLQQIIIKGRSKQ